MVYDYFPRLRERRQSLAGYTSGGEQQMCAIGRALMSQPEDDPARRAVDGARAADRARRSSTIVRSLNESEGVSFLLAEQNTNMALRYAAYGYILENGRVVLDGAGGDARARTRTSRSSISASPRASASRFRDVQALQAPQALAGVKEPGRSRAHPDLVESGCALDSLSYRMSFSENRLPLFRDML